MEAVINSLLLFAAVFLAILIENILKVKMNNPIELLKGEQKGEKEPKTSWISGICSVIFLGMGYIMAIKIDKPIAALQQIFICIVLVIAGTYCLFTSGSIIILKALKKNKNYYYKPKNFISVSGMIYRLKHNAVGLATIAILSTAILVTISTTVALYAGQEENLKISYPLDVNISIKNPTEGQVASTNNDIKKQEQESNISIDNLLEFENYELFVKSSGNQYELANRDNRLDEFTVIQLCLLDDYNRIEQENIELKDNEILLYSIGKDNDYDSISIYDTEFSIKEKIQKLKTVNKNYNDLTEGYIVIVKDKTIIEKIFENNNISNDKYFYSHSILFDMNGSKDNITNYCDSLESVFNSNENIEFNNIYKDRKEDSALNGGFLFIGSFLGLLFLLGTVLIIYYKQISEGYEDSKRFKIMQKVGMSREEIKSVINKQILMVFFFPLGISLIHMGFAFKPISKLLGLFKLYNTNIFLISVGITSIIFAILYGIVYWMTANVYYKIICINENNN